MDRESLLTLTCINQNIALFDFDNVLVLKDYKERENVRIVSGGAVFYGHFIGKGMLTASVQGENNQGVPSKLILRTLRELSYNHIKGILIVVQANSSEILNFGLATECALNDNLRVKFLVISDDCDNDLYPKLTKRGLSGIVLVQKIAGAMAEVDKSLTDIYNFCEIVVKNMTSTVVVDQQKDNSECRYCRTCFEKNLGVESKRFKKDNENGDSDVINISEKITSILDNLKIVADDNVVILVNKLKILPIIDETSLVRDIINILTSLSIKIHRFYIGYYLKMPDENTVVTITILKIFDRNILEYLDAPTNATGWIPVNQTQLLNFDNNISSANLKRKERLAPPIRGPKLSERHANILLLSLQFACDALISCENQLNIIDSEKDGDTGTRMRKVCEILMKRMKTDKIITNYPFTFFEGLSKILDKAVGSTLGCIYGIIFEAAANKFGEYSENDEVDAKMWLKALEMACEALKRYGNVQFGDKTMYDPLYVCYTKTKESLENNENFIEAYEKGVLGAQECAARAKEFNAKQPDAGAHAVGIWLRAAYEAVKLRC